MKKVMIFSLLPLFLCLFSACEKAVSPTPETSPSPDDPSISPSPTLESPSEDDIWRTPFTDSLDIDFEYEGRSFLEDGIGEVELSRCIDGDTARFTEDGGLSDYSVRFLGIDTPETGRNPEPWAYAASDHVCDALSNADSIVLEWDFSSLARKGTYGRYLGFVWVDGRLLNLELVELAFTHATGFSPKYGEIMHAAWHATMPSGRRIHGERDPDFDYGD